MRRPTAHLHTGQFAMVLVLLGCLSAGPAVVVRIQLSVAGKSRGAEHVDDCAFGLAANHALADCYAGAQISSPQSK